MKINGNIEVDGSFKLKDLITACASVSTGEISISKTVTYGGTQVPFANITYNYGNVFSLNGGKVYCSRKAIIQVDYILLIDEAAENYYVLLGRNGLYVYTGGCSPKNGIAGSTLAGSFQFQINAGEYITLKLGASGTYSNKTVYSGSRLSVFIVRYLDWVGL